MIKKAALLLFSTCFALLLCEEIVRQLFIIPNNIAAYYPLGPSVTNSYIRATQKEYDIEMRYNAYGFRDSQDGFTPRKSDKEVRILFVGDSFTEGVGVKVESRFSNLLFGRLAAEGVRHLKTMNIGQLATNPQTYIGNLTSFGFALDPDVVVMSIYIGNDFMGGRSVITGNPKDFTITQKIDNTNKPSLPNHLMLGYIRKLISSLYDDHSRIVRKAEGAQLWDVYFHKHINRDFFLSNLNVSGKQFDEISKTMNPDLVEDAIHGIINPGYFIQSFNARLSPHSGTDMNKTPYYTREDVDNIIRLIVVSNELASMQGAGFVVLIIPDIYEVFPMIYSQVLTDYFGFQNTPPQLAQLDTIRKKLVTQMRQHHIPSVDIYSALKSSPVMPYFLYDGHLNEAGHKIAADQLQPLLKQAINR